MTRIPERNDPCPCESGKKFKACCGPATSNRLDSEIERIVADGKALESRRDIATAYRRFLTARSLAPQMGRLNYMVGSAELNLGLFPNAVVNLTEGLRTDPIAEGHYNLGLALKGLGRLEEAALEFRAAHLMRPDQAQNLINYGYALLDLGFSAAAVDVMRKCVEGGPASPLGFSNLLLTTQYLPDFSIEEMNTLHRAFGSAMQDAYQPMLPRPADPETKRLRIGFVSGDLRRHPVGLLIADVLPTLKEQAIDVVAFSSCSAPPNDPVRARLLDGVAEWHDVESIDDYALGTLVRNCRIDILVDLSGHTGFNRLGVFALKPAPLQVSWLGYGATTGLDRIDYVFTDAVSTPPEDEPQYTEKVWRLPLPRLPFSPPPEAGEPTEGPITATGSITFGCFNNLAKLNPQVVRAWGRILNGVPDSTLLLKGRHFDQPSAKRALLDGFMAAGVDVGRIRFESQDKRKEYFEAFSRVDIALDPYPFTGGMSTLDALWMGVPVVSKRGDRMIGRQGEMVLGALGLNDWVAKDVDDYVAIAIAKAGDAANLRALRSELRNRMKQAEFAQPDVYGKRLGEAFWAVWGDALNR